MEAYLYQDLDIDSINAVDMVVKLKEITGKAVKSEDFKSACTIALSMMLSKRFIKC